MEVSLCSVLPETHGRATHSVEHVILLRLIFLVVPVLQVEEQSFHATHVLLEVHLLLLELVHERLVLLDVALLLETVIGDVLDAHFVDLGEFGRRRRREAGAGGPDRRGEGEGRGDDRCK